MVYFKIDKTYICKLPKVISNCYVLHNFCQLMGEASSGKRSNVNVDPHTGLNK